MSWHAIFVETGKENLVCSRMMEFLRYSNYKGEYEILVPKRKLQERHQGQFIEVITEMFPGYVLVQTDNIAEIYYKTRECRYLYRFLKNENKFEEIQLEEISNIIYMIDDNGIIGISDVFVKNEMIKVTNGPLCNYTGWIKRIDKHKRRARVIFQFNGQDHLIDLSVNFIRKPTDDEVKSEFLFH